MRSTEPADWTTTCAFPYARHMRKWGRKLRAAGLPSALFVAALGLLSATARAGEDTDGDGIPNELDNCPMLANENQLNTDGDLMGDACDLDDDNDTVLDVQDNCPLVANEDQANADFGPTPGGDNKGDACDADDDNDLVFDQQDNCDLVKNFDQTDTDEDSAGDACDEDDDNDDLADGEDNCALVANHDQADNDQDGLGDACDEDDDNDGLSDEAEAEIGTNPDVPDSDGDGIKDGDEGCNAGACAALDPASDADGDGILDKDEAGDADSGTPPQDTDGDGTPDFLDEDSDADGQTDAADDCLGAICKNGAECAGAVDCASGNCVEGVCCDTPCDSLCETCGTGTCTLLPAGTNPFASDSCVGDIVVGVACNAQGDIEAKDSQACAPFVCDQGACTSSCEDDVGCSATLGYCGADGACLAKKPDNTECAEDRECLTAVCLFGLCGVEGEAACAADGYTLVAADGVTTTDCSPYACQDAECVTSCASVSDCAPPYVCGLDGQCVVRPDVTAEGGCALPASPANGRGLEALLVLPLLAAMRRRRRRDARP